MTNRTPKERGDVIFAITKLHKFYYKPEPDRHEINIWMKSFSKFKSEAVVNALEEAPGTCQYFPRPFDVVKILNAYREAKGSRYQSKKFVPAVKCDPKIAYAWSRFIRMHSDWGSIKVPDIGITMSDEEVIEFCNKEAIKKRIPDAIPDKYKLFELWDAVHEPPKLGSMELLL